MKTNIHDGGFDDFRQMAKDKTLSKYEKIGFPDAYRDGRESAIFADITAKLTNLDRRDVCVLDIGPGCSDLPLMLIQRGLEMGHRTYLIDSEEMLDLLPSPRHVEKYAGAFPNVPHFLEGRSGTIDVILCYSVFQYIFVDYPLFKFLDSSLALLAPGGQMLIGDIPNISRRKRFFSSAAGKLFHKQFTGEQTDPEVSFNRIEFDKIDDAVLISLIGRARAQGFDAYIVPQNNALPMSNRREDVLIVRP